MGNKSNYLYYLLIFVLSLFTGFKPILLFITAKNIYNNPVSENIIKFLSILSWSFFGLFSTLWYFIIIYGYYLVNNLEHLRRIYSQIHHILKSYEKIYDKKAEPVLAKFLEIQNYLIKQYNILSYYLDIIQIYLSKFNFSYYTDQINNLIGYFLDQINGSVYFKIISEYFHNYFADFIKIKKNFEIKQDTKISENFADLARLSEGLPDFNKLSENLSSLNKLSENLSDKIPELKNLPELINLPELKNIQELPDNNKLQDQLTQLTQILNETNLAQLAENLKIPSESEIQKLNQALSELQNLNPADLKLTKSQIKKLKKLKNQNNL